MKTHWFPLRRPARKNPLVLFRGVSLQGGGSTGGSRRRNEDVLAIYNSELKHFYLRSQVQQKWCLGIFLCHGLNFLNIIGVKVIPPLMPEIPTMGVFQPLIWKKWEFRPDRTYPRSSASRMFTNIFIFGHVST